jgi:general stress protein 26
MRNKKKKGKLYALDMLGQPVTDGDEVIYTHYQTSSMEKDVVDEVHNLTVKVSGYYRRHDQVVRSRTAAQIQQDEAKIEKLRTYSDFD